MKLLFGTTNQSKLQHMKEVVKGLNIEIVGLNEVGLSIDDIDESGNNPMENAKIKALAYYEAAKKPVFSCDSGLYIEGVDDNDQPGVHVRRVNGKILGDEELIEYYCNLALKLGGNAVARYKNAICLVLDENNIFEYDGDDISSVPFMLASRAHNLRTPGFPLNSISIEIKSRKYYMDLDEDRNVADNDRMVRGFREFFLRAVKQYTCI